MPLVKELDALSACEALVVLLLALAAALAAATEAAPEAADPALEARMTRSPRSCAAWCARTRRSPTRTRRSRSTCATRSASSCAQGKSDAEIVDFMVARYGDFVLYRPPLKATHRAALARPVGVLLLGGAVLLLVLRPADAVGRRGLRA